MVGIVVVSHSKGLAEEIIKFSMEMAQSDIKAINAGGTSDGGFGTDATKIMEAIKEADDGSGVLILADLGSAVMSANMAIEFLDEEMQKRVRLADAPIVEGSLAAITLASLGASLEEVEYSAKEAKDYTKQ